ncbi:conserved hypothetical protein [Perkinsus marinus ATCC 50983]|uniref:Uncharacterized protein n=1 Tax=Perkinsus marinus (strain ATCC 50983 / TXsc) TaxID=423536 RepID=C5KD31_PERM5|nr:conserved hypothetical protein [Perkinsus marinus ATCC 50983]EER17780.1 conserved hypothetical protein [Perkinsus marinus ATCC 50983]|eukprot:XP_002785984.1 conserved hypothetical protein [Perkinsus marinus ATCC 50983]
MADGSICSTDAPSCTGVPLLCSESSIPSTTTRETLATTEVPSPTASLRGSTTGSPFTTKPTVTNKPSSSVDCTAVCESLTGCSTSYCADWAYPAVCHGLGTTAGGSPCVLGDPSCTETPLFCGGSDTSTRASVPTDVMTTTTRVVPTTSLPTTVTTGTSTTQQPTASIASNPGSSPQSGCPDVLPESDVFWWIEWPSMDSTIDDWTTYYRRIFDLLTNNCAYMRVTKLMLRVLDPEFPSGSDASHRVWYPNGDVTQSVMYTELLSKLDQTSVRELEMMPYVFDEPSRQSWLKWAPENGGPMSGAYAFAAEYNEHLTSVKFTGLTTDYEELEQSTSDYALLTDPQGESAFKGGHLELDFGIGLGYYQWSRFPLYTWTQHFYMEVYDIVTPFGGVDNTDQSRFLLYKDDPEAMVNYIVNEVLDANTKAAFSEYSERAHLMWSIQSMGLPCQYPLNNGNCGDNHEFGEWSSQAFNQFLQLILPALGTGQQQGVYQIDYLPYQMMPVNMRTCHSFGCDQ